MSKYNGAVKIISGLSVGKLEELLVGQKPCKEKGGLGVHMGEISKDVKKNQGKRKQRRNFARRPPVRQPNV